MNFWPAISNWSEFANLTIQGSTLSSKPTALTNGAHIKCQLLQSHCGSWFTFINLKFTVRCFTYLPTQPNSFSRNQQLCSLNFWQFKNIRFFYSHHLLTMTHASELSPQQTHLGDLAVLDVYFEEHSIADQLVKFSWVQLNCTITWCPFWESWLMLVSNGQKMTKGDRWQHYFKTPTWTKLDHCPTVWFLGSWQWVETRTPLQPPACQGLLQPASQHPGPEMIHYHEVIAFQWHLCDSQLLLL